MVVKGIVRSHGNYQGNTYDNYLIYSSRDESENRVTVCGNPTDLNVKVKASVLHELVTEKDVPKLLGHDLEFYYDAFKNVCKVILKE